MIWYGLLILPLILLIADVLWDWKRSGRLFYEPLPRPFRDRPSQADAWRQACPAESSDKADRLLITLCEAFGFHSDDRYQFGPMDRIWDVYQARYPRRQFWKIADSLEVETLLIELGKRFDFDDKDLANATLQEIVGLLKPRPTAAAKPAPSCSSTAESSSLFRLVGRALAVWLVIITAEIVHGILRAIALVPYVGEFRSNQIGVLTGSALILAISCLTIRWMGPNSRMILLLIGLGWAVLTVAFEVLFGRFVMGLSWERLAADYHLLNGGLLPLGLMFLAISPWLAARLRRIA